MSQWPAPTDPVPVQAIPYAMPTQARPGMVTAIGVISIVVACATVLVSLYTGGIAVAMYFASQASATMKAAAAAQTTTPVNTPGVPAPAAVPLPAPAPRPKPKVASPTLTPEQRRTIAEAMNKLETLAPARKRQLNDLIAVAGAQVLPGEAQNLTVPRVRAMVTDHGKMPAATSASSGAHFFVTGTGRLEIYDDHAVFFPVGSAGDTVRTGDTYDAADETADSETDTDDRELIAVDVDVTPPSSVPDPNAAPASPNQLSPAEVQAVLNQVTSRANKPLTAAQITTLTSILQGPNQTFATPGVQAPAVISVYVQPNGSATIAFYNGSITMGPGGNVVSQFTTATGGPMGGFGAGPVFNVSPVACTLTAIEALLSVALAVFLFIAGIMVLRGSQRGRKLHLIYAIIKIPIALGGWVAFMWLFQSMMSGFPGGGAGVTWSTMLPSGLIMGAIACAYPIALLIALNTATLKDYFRSGAGGA